ncbi:DUF1254 domain-containing protein [Adhaeribacter terreus]|uniref:DUF1254 domain-containing protein n=1 Tax=Adhaeribacter terreus TaxID=529703 RepID=A0ABW0EGI2_9BACT
MKKSFYAIVFIIATISCQSNKNNESATSEQTATNLKSVTSDTAFFSENGRIVTPDTYPTDETSRQILKGQSLVGVNKFVHNRELTPTDDQPVVRINRDTYYSMAVVDVSKGATIEMPDIPEGKYMSVQPVTEDHRIQKMMYGPGSYDLSTHTGTHLYLIIRLDGTFTKEEAKAIQDQMRIKSNSNNLFATEPINKESFYKVESELKAKVSEIVKRDGIHGMKGMFTNPRDESAKDLTVEKYQVGAAAGWGGAQLIDNIYESSGNFSTDSCYQLTFEDPKNGAFWSITVYDKNGFMFNDLANFSSNTAKKNQDGTYTISFGCGKDAPNNLEIDNPSNKFNILARHYRPSKRVTEDGYRIVPLIKVVSSK